jgi:TIR domain
MAEVSPNDFPVAADRLGAIVAAILRSTGSANLAQLVMASSLRSEYAFEDFGIRHFHIIVEVPVAEFVPVRDGRDVVESSLLEAFQEATRQYANDQIDRVVVAPTLPDGPGASLTTRAAIGDHLWPPKTFRLFVSHLNAYATQVAALSEKLAIYGVACFVAHRDIGVTREWRGEILAGLQSMDAMAVILTDGYHASDWTDHEYGFALGSGRPTITVMVGSAHPYGFLEREQGMHGDLADPRRIADEIVKVLLDRPDSGPAARRALVTGLETSRNWIDSNSIIMNIVSHGPYDADELQRMEDAIKNNEEVARCARFTNLRRFLDGP